MKKDKTKEKEDKEKEKKIEKEKQRLKIEQRLANAEKKKNVENWKISEDKQKHEYLNLTPEAITKKIKEIVENRLLFYLFYLILIFFYKNYFQNFIF